ncbi:MAG: MipA/OmpV family protein [Pseudomonadota bacterium]
MTLSSFVGRGPWRAIAFLSLLFQSEAIAQGVEVSPSRAETQPLWELGVGAFVSVTPNYPASGEYRINGLPFPNVVYRGDLLRLGQEEAARLVPVDTERFELSVSGDAAFGVDSDDNELRRGLPDLDPLLQIGPELVLKGRGFGTPSFLGDIALVLQGRAVFSANTDIEIDFQGFVVEPQLRTTFPGVLGLGSFVTASVGPLFATEALQDYFYEVPSAFALPDRPTFEASAGYLGSELTFGLGYELTERIDLFASLRLALYSGAANADSPLFEDAFNASGFVSFTYSIFQSERRVPRRR